MFQNNPEDNVPGLSVAGKMLKVILLFGKNAMKARTRTNRYLFRGLIAAIAVILLLILVAALMLPSLERKLKEQMVEALRTRFQSDVELQNLNLSVFPRLTATGQGLKLWYQGRKDIPPLISVDSFIVTSRFPNFFREVKTISYVELNKLVIQIPPKNKPEANKKSAPSQEMKPKPVQPPKPPKTVRFLISEINADGTVLKILPSRPDRDPMVFELHKMRLESVGLDKAMLFRATLKNAKPPGMIQTEGQFGPWNAPDPGGTPVSGKYTFRDADLSDFKGIRGHLASDGEYSGTLEHLDAKGTTNVPDFGLERSKNVVHLQTKFHAVIDGTSGDTLLQPVNAQLIKTHILCVGGVTGKKGVQGKWVRMNAEVKDGRVQDLLLLAVDSPKPLLTGLINFKAKIEIPPEDVDVIQKINIDGTFDLQRAHFKDFTVQEKIEELSKKGRGEPDDTSNEKVVSNMSGEFRTRKGTIYFPRLTFAVPGAIVALAGSYGLRSEAMDFEGELRMDAKISETQKGIKSFLLKAVDPFFKKKGYGAVIPIKITGTRSKPTFGLNFGGSDKKDDKKEDSKKKNDKDKDKDKD
jgi:hypothetical protein